MSKLRISALIMREIMCCFLGKCTHLALLAPPVVKNLTLNFQSRLDIFQDMYVVKTYIERWSYFCGDAMATVFFHAFPRSNDAMFAIYIF